MKLPRHLLITIYSWAGRLISIVCSLYSLKLITQLLGVESYSIYLILSNVVTWAMLCDFGLGYALQNYISELRSKGEDYKKYIFLTVLVIIIVLIVISILLLILSPFLSNLLFGKISIIEPFLLESTFFIACIIGLLTALGSISTKIFFGLQNGHISVLLISFAGILNILGLYCISYFKIVSLISVLCVTLGINAIITIFPLIYFVVNSNPNRLYFDKDIITRIIKRGGKFGGFALMSACVLQVDYLIMSQHIKPSEIVSYSLLFKLFSVVFIAYHTLLSTLWPMFCEWGVINKNDLIWSTALKYIIYGCCLFLVFTFIFIVWGDDILRLITDIKVTLPVNLILLMGFYFGIRVWTDMFATVLQSNSYLRPLWILTPIQALISITLQIYLSLAYGIIGIVIALIISFLTTVSWALPVIAYKKLK